MFKKKKKITVLQATKDFTAQDEDYNVKKDELIYLTDSDKSHSMLWITKSRANAMIKKGLVKEVEIKE